MHFLVKYYTLFLFSSQPFIMVRKQGKWPNSITGAEYFKEYVGASSSGGDSFCFPKNSCRPGDRILVIDDLIVTGVSSHIFFTHTVHAFRYFQLYNVCRYISVSYKM